MDQNSGNGLKIMTDRLSPTRRGEPLAQYVEALRARQSALADFHALRQDFSPPIRVEHARGETND